MSIKKMNDQEAREYVEKERGGSWEDYPEYVRDCFGCGMWVDVDDFSGEVDRCDDCIK